MLVLQTDEDGFNKLKSKLKELAKVAVIGTPIRLKQRRSYIIAELGMYANIACCDLHIHIHLYFSIITHFNYLF